MISYSEVGFIEICKATTADPPLISFRNFCGKIRISIFGTSSRQIEIEFSLSQRFKILLPFNKEILTKK